MQSDQGSNFMSRLFKEVMRELGIEQCTSSAYHPESQGVIELFHQTLKIMIKCYCLEHPKDWDESVQLLLFAIRESVQESLGFSPFELVFGHTVRGPLKLLKEKWLVEDPMKTDLLTYVSTFKERLQSACDLAGKNLAQSQTRMKTWYDKKSKVRSFKPGDKVLVLLPVIGSPLSAKYHGPYVVDSKVSDLNYIVKTPDRRKSKQLCHINILKEYIDREKESSINPEIVACRNTVKPIEITNTDNVETNIRLKNSEILSNIEKKLEHLPLEELLPLASLIREYECLFRDVPSKTTLIKHDVEIIDGAKPVREHPYRVNPLKMKIMDDEVKYMFDNDMAEDSYSDWSSTFSSRS